MRATRMLLALLALLAISTASVARAQSNQPSTPSATIISPKPTRAGYADVNGLHMYYEIHGTQTGDIPLVLVHGGGSTIGTNFARVIPLLKRSRQIIAVELQAHGHTRDIDRPFTFEQCADDVAALLGQLHVAKADVFGFSNGGTTALQLAIRHPAVANRLIIGSANYKRDGMVPGFWAFMKKGTYADMPQPYKDAYLAINPSQQGVHAMHDRDSDRMLAFKDIPDSAVHAIQAPSLVIVGDQDVIRPEHALELSRLLAHGRLSILPGGHGEYLGEIMFPKVDDRMVNVFVTLVDEFLASPGK
jgi:pimeloyl-ACP methyl ester carboxylesterase